MVIQLPGTLRDNAFVTSDQATVEQGRQEVSRWMSDSDYAGSYPDRVFAIFDDGEVVREWNVVEKRRSTQTQTALANHPYKTGG